MPFLIPVPFVHFFFTCGKLHSGKVFCIKNVFLIAVRLSNLFLSLLLIFCFDFNGHEERFLDFYLIGFHKSKASFLDFFFAKEKGTDFFQYLYDFLKPDGKLIENRFIFYPILIIIKSSS